ncbi:MAG TPA: hypothetical protein VD835_14820 [Pyrinomonadaceae bacterium]|nr:hypothetical protein [Pyrinomonadaceae bacterium]
MDYSIAVALASSEDIYSRSVPGAARRTRAGALAAGTEIGRRASVAGI